MLQDTDDELPRTYHLAPLIDKTVSSPSPLLGETGNHGNLLMHPEMRSCMNRTSSFSSSFRLIYLFCILC